VKKIGIFALVTLVMLLALVLYAVTVLGQYEDLEKKLSDDYVTAAKSLQELDQLFPNPAAGSLDEKRFVPWMEAREILAGLLKERFEKPKSVTRLQVRETRNMALAKLAETLDHRSMGISEYCAISARWRAILARDEFKDLQNDWRQIVRTQSTPEGMSLPEAAADAKPDEIALIKKHAAQLLATMDADKLSILLDLIAGGEIPVGEDD